jgi:ABC-type sugar transport system permease subunit
MKNKPRKGAFRQNLYAYLLIAPGLLLVGLILIYPLVRGIISSFFIQTSGSMEFEMFVGLKYYKELLSDKIFSCGIHGGHCGCAVYLRPGNCPFAEQKF